MALIKSDRVKETSTSTGATTFALAGAGTGYRTFSSVCAIGDTFYYAISNQSNGEWEAGLGTYSALNTLTRTAVHSSSNSGNVVTFTSGTKEVFLTLTARHLDRINDNGQSTAIGSKTSVVAVNDSATLPDLDLQFSELKTLTAKYGPTPSYSRASTGTYFNASGVLTSAAINAPRFDHVYDGTNWVSKGLLIEEQRTNLCTYSEDITNASWGKYNSVAILSNNATAPDGTLTADRLYPTLSGANLIEKVISGQTNGSTYSYSYYAKSAGFQWICGYEVAGGANFWVDVINGVVGTKATSSAGAFTVSIAPAGNGWFKISVTSNSNSTNTYLYTSPADANGNTTSTPSGTNGILYWGFQFELGSFPTSYIPTVASSVVRSADVCQITGSSFTNLWNASEGSYSIEYNLLSTLVDQPLFYANNGGFNESHRAFGSVATNQPPLFLSRSSFVTDGQFFLGLTPVTSGKIAIGVKANDLAGSVNGGAVVTDTTVAMPLGINQLLIGIDNTPTRLNGHIARLRYFRSRLDNTQLVNLSGGINTLAFKPVTGSGSVTVANEYSGINISVPNPLPITNGGTGGTTAVSAAVNLIKSAPNDGAEYTLKSKQISGSPSFYWVDSTGYAPTLDLLFAADKSLTPYTGPTPSFSRASTGTYFNSSGILSSAAINAPRFNHVYNGSSWVSKGLLVEEQRTNNILQSQDLTVTWTTNRGSITANATTAPDGTNTADRFVEDTANGVHGPVQFAITTTNGSANTVSGFFKAGSRSVIVIRFQDNATGSNGVGAEFNLSNGTISVAALVVGTFTSPSATITNVGGGWYRCTVTGVSTTTSCSLRVETCTTTGVLSAGTFRGSIYTGDGSSYFDSWGYQLEAGSFPTSYIPTTTAAVTRSADVCQIYGSNFQTFWNAPEGTFVVEYDKISNSGYGYQFSASNYVFQSVYGRFFEPNDTASMWNSTQQANLTTTPATAGSLVKKSITYKVNDFAMSYNGASPLTDTTCSVPTGVVYLDIGNSNLENYYNNGHIARLRYYPTRLPNATLQVLST